MKKNNKFEFLVPFKKPLILAGVAFAVFLVIGKIIPAIQESQSNKSPIVSINAENETVYSVGTQFSEEDFTVTAKHKNGDTSNISSEEIKLSINIPGKVGKYTTVIISLKENTKISTSVKVKNERKKLESFYCGSPNIKDAQAILYSNGELAFEGKGDILQFDQGDFPWQQAENEVYAISFEEDIKPVNMDYWFEGLETLTYISPLPDSVESVVGMCKDCIELKKGVDWSQCKNLLDITSVYEDCTSMKKIYPIPSTVRTAASAFLNCTELQTAPDMTKAASLTNASQMYQDCKKLTETNTAPHLQILDEMYSGCINLKEQPEIAAGAISLESTFQDCQKLVTTKRIPETVKNVSMCYSGCGKLQGELIIDANPEEYSSFLDGVANATTLNLKGNSKILDLLANTNEGNNIRVNGREPITDE